MTAYLIVYGRDPGDRFAAYAYATRKEAWAASTSSLVPGFPEQHGAGGCAYVIETEADVTFDSKLLVGVFNALAEPGVKRFESRAIGVRRLLSILPQTAAMVAPTETEENDEMAKKDGETTKKTRKARAVKLGEFSPIRRTSNLGKIVEALLPDGADANEITTLTDLEADKILAELRRGRVTHGVDYALADDGRITLVLPEGKIVDDLFVRPKEKPAKAASNGAKSPIADADTIRLLVDANPKRPTAAAHARFALYRTGQTVAEFLAAGGTKADLSWDRGKQFIEIVRAA